MRLYLFRVYNKVTNDFEYFDFSTHSDFYPDNIENIEQFVGYTDKKGVKVFDGDIVQDDYRSKPILVEWDNKKAQYSLGGYGNDHITVIGNVHQNKNLLEGK